MILILGLNKKYCLNQLACLLFFQYFKWVQYRWSKNFLLTHNTFSQYIKSFLFYPLKINIIQFENGLQNLIFMIWGPTQLYKFEQVLFLFCFPFFFFFFFFFFLWPHLWHMEVPRVGVIRAAASGLYHSQSNVGSLTHWVMPGIEPVSSWILVGFLTTEPQTGTLVEQVI